MSRFRTPGSNILRMAQTALGKNDFNFYLYEGVTQNDSFVDVAEYALPITVGASIQAVDRSLYQKLGLQLDSRYIEIWTTLNVDDLDRVRPSDRIGFLGRLFKLDGENDWTPIDGWNSFLAVDIGPEVQP